MSAGLRRAVAEPPQLWGGGSGRKLIRLGMTQRPPIGVIAMNLDVPTQRRGSLTRWIWIGYWAAMFVATHRPLSPGLAAAISGLDKVAHFAIYLLLTVLGGWHARRSGRRLSAAWMLAWAVVYAAYGAVDELLQPYVERTASLGDWAADLAGITVGTLITALWRPLRGGREAGVRPIEGNVTPD